MGAFNEKDMQIREIKEGYQFLDKLYATYPIIGNALIKESTQEKINAQAKQALDKLVENPSYFSAVSIKWHMISAY